MTKMPDPPTGYEWVVVVNHDNLVQKPIVYLESLRLSRPSSTGKFAASAKAKDVIAAAHSLLEEFNQRITGEEIARGLADELGCKVY